MSFTSFYNEKTLKQGKFYHSYLGIKRKEYPKWQGWKYIDKIKSQSIPIEEVQDPYLENLVKNFYLVMYLSNKSF